jgi:hypothetical protein
MSGSIEIKLNVDDVFKRFANLSSRDVRSALSRALNRTAVTARAQSAREIRAAGYGIQIGAIKKAISLHRAAPTKLQASVVATGRPIPLINYGARQTKLGTSVKVKGTRKLIKGAFIATMPTGHRGVFVRIDSKAHERLLAASGIKAYGGKRGGTGRAGAAYKHGLPIRELFGPSIPAAFRNDVVQRAVRASVGARLPIVLGQELNFRASKARE